MAEEVTMNRPTALAGIALRYPEKTFYLGQVFNDTATSYKYVWFLALLSLIRRSEEKSILMSDILTEIAVIAWHPVCLYRLSLGRQDTLQKAILAIREKSNLKPDADGKSIRGFVASSPETQAALDYFKRHVPTRFLTPWFADKLRGVADYLRDGQIQRFARESQGTPFACPYWFDAGSICLNESWRMFLVENAAVAQAFAEYHLALYLQSRNPNVPGVVNKLRAPTQRQLTTARQFWRLVHADFQQSARAEAFRDIYADQPLGDSFAIDHFLPWSFVVHDLLWNLTPVEPTTNSRKNDVLPDLDLYLPRLAKLHFSAIQMAKKRPKALEDYIDCFKLDASEMLALGENGFAAKYREVILPQAQIAINQGFQSGWRLHSPAVFVRTERESVSGEFPRRHGQPAAEGDASERVLIELFPEQGWRKPSPGHLPYYSLAIAAGGFLAGDAPEAEGWVEVAKHGFSKRLAEGMFVTRVVGESMAPTIKNGSYCVFRSPVEGTRQGRIVLVQKRDMTDPETGGSYTVKRYQSLKSAQEGGWHHESIQLIPDNPDRQKFPVLEFSAEDDADLRVVAEFIQMLSPAT
jgi:phage repressor protein C with HTH and peptisase S24 domain